MIHMAEEIHPKPTSLCSHRFQCSLSALEQLGAARGVCTLADWGTQAGSSTVEG